MAKKILLVESDADFARDVSSLLERKGFETRTTADGKEGLDLARDERPDAIVLCVELPKLSGYSICNKLKKDEALKSIPLVIISAEATPDTFEQHKKLKTRAEDYLIKPFEPAQLLERLAALIGMPEASTSEEEIVTLADVELEALVEPEPAASLPPEIAHADAIPEEDEDLRLLDDAFESIATPTLSAEGGAVPPLRDELSFAGEAKAAAKGASKRAADELVPPLDKASVIDDGAALLAALDPAGQDEQPAPAREEEAPRRAGPVRGANLRALRAAGIPVLEIEPSATAVAPAFGEQALPQPAAAPISSRALEVKEQELESSRREIAQRDAELRRVRERVEELEERLARAETDLRERDANLASTQSQLEGLSSSAKKLEADLQASREEAQGAGKRAVEAEKNLAQMRERAQEAERNLAKARDRAQEAERNLTEARERAQEAERAVGEKAAEAAEALGKLEASEQDLEGLRAELATARNEVTTARSEVDQHGTELHRRVQELEAANSKNEERVVKAYQKIKSDEKLREKTRKALTIALQLLDEHGPAPDLEKQRTVARE